MSYNQLVNCCLHLPVPLLLWGLNQTFNATIDQVLLKIILYILCIS